MVKVWVQPRFQGFSHFLREKPWERGWSECSLGFVVGLAICLQTRRDSRFDTNWARINPTGWHLPCYFWCSLELLSATTKIRKQKEPFLKRNTKGGKNVTNGYKMMGYLKVSCLVVLWQSIWLAVLWQFSWLIVRCKMIVNAAAINMISIPTAIYVSGILCQLLAAKWYV